MGPRQTRRLSNGFVIESAVQYRSIITAPADDLSPYSPVGAGLVLEIFYESLSVQLALDAIPPALIPPRSLGL